ncbi:related to caffeoyl-coa o-methyltransferase [Serendipita indica DSM 11827]|uniref:Related to caffeoyl-coa o-methyltransferase n=1 Tax=Serendipita indica (strain DSM 11827) TaxID=1109443 RepID=G4TD21_SERID|nr:related to caffeoyl-coa o-methyltransferase [Serendipita indica DSM 11827]
MSTLHETHDASGRQLPTYSQQAEWERSDTYHNSFLIKPDEDLSGALTRSVAEGLPDIAVSEAQGKFLFLLCKSIGAKRVLEVGTLGGYSTIWMAKALPADGYIITHELYAEHAAVATENFKQAGLSSKIRVVQGPAIDNLHKIPSSEPFDLVFIDADKTNNANYFREAERLVRPGGVIIVDNVVRRGRVADPNITDEAVEGTRELLRYIKGNKGVEATTMATVGTKGWDGFLYAVKL